tara:strand:- start:9048 stop:9320 length:273 start_codon:yes stop_codon:yes gene_type:complete
MAFASSTTNLNQLFPSSENISIVWGNLNKSLQAKKKQRQTIKELNQLTDKDLADIGLCRGDINAVAKGSVDHLIKRGVNIDPDYFNLNKI